MGAINDLVGGHFATTAVPIATADNPNATEVPVNVVPDGTEWAVAVLVLGALGVIILFRMAGFQAVIAASAKVGG